ncbi:MFS transporter [Rubrobacter indicoceani]|uniref:MFS transporter n=1 Tax=Rubrobacter indicoceani TaxID=2051957 RepID=UPI000E5B45C7|nr:MFS transporter [Rubrobacter indicoceani]
MVNRGFGRSSLVVLFVTVFLDMLGYGIIVPLLPFIAEEYGADALAVGLLVSLYALMQMFGGPFLGGLSDGVGRRPVILACLLVAASAYLLLGLAGSVLGIAFAVAVAGLAGGTPATAQAYIADSTSGDERAKGLGVIGASFGLGLMVGPALGGLLGFYFGLSAPAFFAAALALTNFVFGWFVLGESLAPEGRRRVPLRLLNPVSQVAAVVRISGVRVLLGIVLLLNLALAGLVTNFPLFGEARFGWGPAGSGLFFAFVGVCAVATQGLLIGPVQRFLGEIRMLGAGLAVVAAGLVCVAFLTSGSLIFPVVGVMAFGFGVAIPAVASLLSRRVGSKEQGRLMGAQQAVLSFSLVVGPPLAGLVFDTFGPGAPYLLGGLLVLTAGLFTVKAGPRT